MSIRRSGPATIMMSAIREIILTRLAVKDGRIVLPDGMSYRLLVLPESATMPVEVLPNSRSWWRPA